ncbi:phage integrase family protein [Neorickettsia helminthoeca str. Oregon]|uniref:Phage integrase family protein n=2 Tax=Neorickettsia helminthoeca TaxID=33994 RepID=X5HJ61_9RICK|nr:phage integrase family protein [Neorickettsia helminthoeca str. Oregon]
MLVERNASFNTIASYKTDLVLLQKFLEETEFIQASKEDLCSYITGLKERGYSSATIRRKIATLRQFYTFLYFEKLIYINPMKDIELPKKALILPRYLIKEEIKGLLTFLGQGYPDTLRLHTMLEMLYASGMRVSELIRLKIADIGPLLKGQQHIIIQGKGRKERILPFSKRSIEVLIRYLHSHQSTSEWLFPGTGGKNRHISRQRLGQLLKELAIKCNIAPERISPHVIRHSFATHLLDRGMDIKLVQDLLGHSQITTTQIYTHVSQQELHREVISHHPLSKKNP